MPDGIERSVAGLPPKAMTGLLSIERTEEATVYSALIEPVFAVRCATCHNPTDLRGGLRLDTPEGILEGGQSGEVLIAGSPEASELIRRMWLPLEHADHMPPEDRPQPSVAQAELVRWWIDGGASFETRLSEAERTPIVQTIFDGYGLDEIRTGIFALDVAPPDGASVEALREFGADVNELGENEPFLEVRCVDDACTGVDLAAVLEPVSEQIAWLDLGHGPATDGTLGSLPRLRNLTRLHLEGTAVTDAGLAHIAGLQYLEYLNLYATSITDEGLQHLTGLPRLRALYLWQTEVTSTGAERLRAALPDLDVNLGVAMPAEAADAAERP